MNAWERVYVDRAKIGNDWYTLHQGSKVSIVDEYHNKRSYIAHFIYKNNEIIRELPHHTTGMACRVFNRFIKETYAEYRAIKRNNNKLYKLWLIIKNLLIKLF